jgi:hypothetical protein
MFDRKRAWFIYNQFTEEERDMSFQEFCKELDALTDPKQAAHDMKRMQLTQQFQRDNARIIDKRLAEKRGGTGISLN